MSKSERRAKERLDECFSWRGDDFDVVGGDQSSVGRYAKKTTKRARRRDKENFEDILDTLEDA